jgi:hypothetical protein
LDLCSKLVALFELVALRVVYFELAWVMVFYDSDSRQSCDCYGILQRLAHHRVPKPVSAIETRIKK